MTILRSDDASFAVGLATSEVRRYLYLRTGEVPVFTPRLPSTGMAVVAARKNDAIFAELLDPETAAEAHALGPEQYLLRTVTSSERRLVCIIGGDDAGVMYGAYRFCEIIGVRFYLHGDTVPDTRLTTGLPIVNESGRPLFESRGILPFHDFPEGPDWWSRDDYLAYVSQMAKMRMNLLALHCYPEDTPRPDPQPHPEPLVWIGRPKDLDADGSVKTSYPSFWASTQRRGYWGYDPMRTSEFTGGSAQLFAHDTYASEIFDDLPAEPQNPDQCNEVFNNAGAMLGEVFAYARSRGIKSCIGTETPLTVPQAVQARLRQEGARPGDPQVVRELYEGIFSHILKKFPVDYYWLWTPEDWTWGGNKPEQFAATVTDIKAALAALEALGHPFTLATAGWVLGPAQDRTALDRVLPLNVPMSCINREVGHDLVEAGFANVSGRPKWAIPWLENDQNLTSPQLWVARMRYDAVDARKLGCTGLLGIHWRTRVIAPNIAALAAAAWDQSFSPASWDLRNATAAGSVRGSEAGKSPRKVPEGTGISVYQSALEGCDDCYVTGLPDGTYVVTLMFIESRYGAAGSRLFDVALQGRTVERKLDIFARAGRDCTLDLQYRNIKVGDGCLHLHLTPLTGEPCITALGIEGTTVAGASVSRWINLGGGVAGKFEGDWTREKPTAAMRNRGMPADDFYVDFARANFGESMALPAGHLLSSIDGLKLPQSSHWERGPGEINVLKLEPGTYDYVDRFADLRPKIEGSGNLARFDYWLQTFRFQKAMATVGGLRSDLDDSVLGLQAETDPIKKAAIAEAALSIRLQLANAWTTMMSLLVSCVETPGELGTVANLEQHNRKRLRFLNLHDDQLVKALGHPLPAGVEPSMAYEGKPRLVVPSLRDQASKGEVLRLSVFAMAREPMTSVTLHWRSWEGDSFHPTAARHVGRAVFSVSLPPCDTDIEYYLTATTAEGQQIVWPATAPQICQTIISVP